MHRLRPSYVLAFLWAARHARRLRRLLADGLPDGPLVAHPPTAASADRRAVVSALHRIGATCLVRSLVLQAWDAAHGRPRDLIIGVTHPRDFQAHAWLDGDPAHHGEFHELLRRPAHLAVDAQ